MLVVLASRSDAPARALVGRWVAAGQPAVLMTCVDLAIAGWRVEIGDDDVPWRGIIGARAVGKADVTAVVNRLPAVTVREVDFVHANDRVYASAEMQAFLMAWLTGLDCPVLNRPTPGCLNGRAWSLEQWTRCAAGTGLPTRHVRRQALLEKPAAEPRPEGKLVVAHVVGKQAFGDADAKTRKAAVEMAEQAGVEVLRAHFEPEKRGADRFVHADYWIDVDDPAVAGALLERCRS